MAQSTADRILLFGLLARLMDFITNNALIRALNEWASKKDSSVGQILVQQGELAADDEALLESLVRRLIEKHDNDPRRGLEAVSTVTAIRPDPEQIADHDLAYSLRTLPRAEVTSAPQVDEPSARASGASNSVGSRFRLDRFHRKGGQGEVWIAKDTELHRDVALKQLQEKYADNSESRARFIHEAEVTGALEHRGIAPVYGLGHFENGHPFYAMRFISGTSLKDAIDRYHEVLSSTQLADEHLLELRRLLARFVDVCNTVGFAHSRGVIHRDLKPGNIILDEYGEALVVDWGLAKVDCSEVEGRSVEPSALTLSSRELHPTIEGIKKGTPAYMSPEQAEGRISQLGPATDVYSLGATLYSLLTGKPPIDDRDTSVVLARVRAGEFPWPSHVKPAVPAALEAICLKAMALNPDERYTTPRALGEEIERWLADQPVLAYPEPLPARATRWVRHHRQWVAAAAALLVLSVIGLALHIGQIRREQARTTDQLAMTRDALRELLGVSGEKLALIPNTEGLRNELAQLVLDRYQRLGEKFPGDAGIRLETASVLRVIGGIGRLTGQFEQSQTSYGKAIDLLQMLSEAEPRHPDYHRWLVESFTDRGELFHMNGRTADAERDFQAAISQADKIPVHPGSPLVQRNAKAAALIDLAEILILKNEHANAYQSAEQAVDLLHPGAVPSGMSVHEARKRWLLSMALMDRAVASKEAGKQEHALQDLEDAALLARQVPQDDDWFDDMQLQLATILNHRGELLAQDQARLAEADESYNLASGILLRLIKNHAVMPQYREEMVTTLLGQASLRLAQGRIQEAQHDCETALQHLGWLQQDQVRRKAQENPQYLYLHGQMLSEMSQIEWLQGKKRESRKTLDQAVKKLSRALEIDPARLADKVKLEELKARSAQSER
jgi:serine/threonine-protein kinase